MAIVHRSGRRTCFWRPSRPLVRSARIGWKPPVNGTVHKLLTNPVYADAYEFGRTVRRVTAKNGRKRVARGLRRDRAEWDVPTRPPPV